jgi:hypothetical protein
MWQQFGKGGISLQMVRNQSCKHLYWSPSAETWGLHSSHHFLFGLTAFQWHHEQSSKNSTLDCHEDSIWALIQLSFALTTHHPPYPLSTLVSSLQSAVESCKTRHTFVKDNLATTSCIMFYFVLHPSKPYMGIPTSSYKRIWTFLSFTPCSLSYFPFALIHCVYPNSVQANYTLGW